MIKILLNKKYISSIVGISILVLFYLNYISLIHSFFALFFCFLYYLIVSIWEDLGMIIDKNNLAQNTQFLNSINEIKNEIILQSANNDNIFRDFLIDIIFFYM